MIKLKPVSWWWKDGYSAQSPHSEGKGGKSKHLDLIGKNGGHLLIKRQTTV